MLNGNELHSKQLEQKDVLLQTKKNYYSRKNKKADRCRPPFKRYYRVLLSDLQVEPVKVHYLVPCRRKILYELFFCVLTGIYFGESSQL